MLRNRDFVIKMEFFHYLFIKIVIIKLYFIHLLDIVSTSCRYPKISDTILFVPSMVMSMLKVGFYRS